MITEVVYTILLVYSVALLNGAYTHLDRRSLIISGTEIAIQEAPYQVIIFINGLFACGGTIIGSKWILTAGHCAEGEISKENSTVRAGSQLLDKEGVVIKIAQAIVHPEYAVLPNNEAYNDIGLLLLEKPLNFDGSTITCALLPDPGKKISPGSLGRVCGFGRTHLTLGRMSLTLRATTLTVLPFEQCQTIYRNFTLNADTQYCIGNNEKHSGSCRGDSGGPFVVDKTIYGIVSWAVSCADPNYPTVYVDVGAYLQWIRDTVASVSPEELCN
ncbi:trypsin-6-like [Sabethes cyaneus]|uniref:trypsin-6-like n=1 Tax=Sabethes cyaneus TaxID=53552 RepID=UPI00237E43E4|nr:trypsin-6-like [Sabethes cyaneus]